MRTLSIMKLVMVSGFIIVLVLAGCTAPAPTASPTTSAVATPKPSSPATATAAPTGPYGDLRIGEQQTQEDSDPTKSSNTYIWHYPWLDTLITLKDGKLAPGVADRWEMAPDSLSWTFYIHKGIKFSNGDALTGKDVKFSMERYMAPEAIWPDMRTGVDHFEMVDDYTVRVYTKGPQPYFPYTVAPFASPPMGYIMPKDYIEKNGIDAWVKNRIGSGPWKYVKSVAGDYIQFEAVPNHWRQTPAFKTLTIYTVPDVNTQIAMLKRGELDIAQIGLDDVPSLEAAGFRTRTLSYLQARLLLGGVYQPDIAGMPTTDIRVRQALSLAINRDDILKNFFNGKASPALPGLLSKDNGDDVDIAYWQDLGAKVYNKYDPTQAKQLLTEAGYPNGFTIKAWSYTLPAAGYYPKLMEVIASYWSKIGVKSDIVSADWSSVFPTSNPIKFPQMRGTGYPMRVGFRSGAFVFRNYIDSQSSIGLLGANYPGVDQKIKDAMAETDLAKRKQMLSDLHKLVADQYVALGIAEVPTVVALGPQVDIDYPPAAISPEQYANITKHRLP